MSTRILMKITYWCLGLIMTLLVAASVAISVIDWNQYRETLSTLVSNQIGMRVDIGGRISAGLFPRPNVSTEGVRLFPATDFGAPQVATANRIEIRLGMVALLKGELAIQHLGFDGLDVTMDQAEDGSWNVRGWPQGEERGAEGTSAAISLDNLKVIGSTVRLVEQNGTERHLQGLSLDLSGSLPAGPLEWVGAFTLAGVPVAMDGRMRPGMDGNAYSVKTEIVLDGGTMVVSGRLEGDGFEGRLRAQGPSLASFSASASTLANNAARTVAVPPQPFDFDIQIDRDTGLHRLTTRALQVGESRGRLDVTVATRENGFHAAGTASLGVIDAAPWIAAVEAAAPSQPVASSAEQASGFTGTLDVAVEGVAIADGMIQQIDAVLAFGSDGPAITNLQALLPGGTGLSLDGHMSAERGEAKLQLVAANLPEFMRWVGVDVSSRIPTGRLATAELSGQLVLDAQSWRLADMEARVDTSHISGAITGASGQPWPTGVQIKADSLNLDAYLTPRQSGDETPQPFEGLPEIPLEYRVSADRIQWGGNQYESFMATGRISRAQAVLEQLAVSQGGGTVKATATASPHASGLAIESEIQLDDWSFPGLRSVVKDTGPYYRALKLGRMDGTLSLSGPLENLLMSAAVERGDKRRMTMSGTVSVPTFTFETVRLQGRFLHDDLGPLLSLQGIATKDAVPADLTFQLSQTTETGTDLGISGSLVGGQLQASGQLNSQQQALDVTYDHARAGDFLAVAGMEGTLPHPERAMRASAKMTLAGGGWSLDDIDIRNGDARLAGRVAADENKRIDGQLTAAGLSFEPMASRQSEAGTRQTSAESFGTLLFDYSGSLSLVLENMTLAGQRLEAPAASLLSGDDIIRFSLGEGALVNGQPSEVSFDVSNQTVPQIKGRANIPAFNIGDMLLSGGLKQAVSGTAALSVEFEGEGQTVPALVQSLNGRATLDGQAGVLNFLSVPQLVQSMNQAQTSSGFLGGIGTLLRTGNTSFSSFGASVTVDAGTALIERAEAQGPWGSLALDGQIDLGDRLMNLQGQLNLTTPPDAPAIPVRYSGSLDNPSSEWTSRALERFVIAGIERRLRATLLKDLDTASGEDAGRNPGAAVFSRALGLLGVLRQQQQEKKAAEEAAANADQTSQ